MKVLVTGGTGFVGSHAVAAIKAAGHDVRLLVRDPARVAPALDPLGVSVDDIVTGDVTDDAAVREAASGCDAVVHGASVFTLDIRRKALIEATNVAGTERVLRLAHEAGHDPIVHISSYGALLPVRFSTIGPDDEPAEGVGVYTKSKADSERVARRLQDEGLPVVSVMPGSVWGPHDPHVGESAQGAIHILKGHHRILTNGGGLPLVDVRDVAAGIAATLQPGQGARRYLLAGTPLSPGDLARGLEAVTGRRRRFIALPPAAIRATGGVVSLSQRVLPFRLPLSGELNRISTQPITGVDVSRAEQELGFSARPAAETLRDTVRSLYEDGHISRKEAGRTVED